MSKNRLDFQAHLSRHSHDIHAGFTASQSTGMIVPQYFHILGPGDSIYYSSHMFARLQDVVTAFLGEIDMHIDAFFVPLQMLYTPFGQIFAQTDDMLSSLIDEGAFQDKEGFPLLNLDATTDSVQNDSSDYLGFDCDGRSKMRLLNALDVNPYALLSSVHAGTADPDIVDDLLCHNPSITPWIFAAYQAIYQKFYRNDEIERLKVQAYNFDTYYNVQDFTSLDLITLRYHQRPKDYFTDIRVSPIASAVNKFGSSGVILQDNGGTLDDVLLKVNSFLDADSLSVSSFSPSVNTVTSTTVPTNAFEQTSVFGKAKVNDATYYPALSTSNIRALFAVDKFARIYGRADKTYDDQVLAHFGIKIPHDVKHDITHLSHYHAVLQSDPVFGTSNVQNGDGDLISTLGQVGGQGSVNFTSKQDKFTAPVHGVFMITCYFLTKPRYFGTFSKLHLLTNRLSFPIPEYDKLGAQPVYAYEANPHYLANKQGWLMSQRIGWQNRYEQFKKRYNRSSISYFGGDYGHGTHNNNVYAPWVISKYPYGMNIPTENTGDFWGYNNLPHTGASAFVKARSLFEDPFALNMIMATQYSPNWSNDYYSSPHLIFQKDPIITEYMCNAKLVSWMSETGEPDL